MKKYYVLFIGSILTILASLAINTSLSRPIVLADTRSVIQGGACEAAGGTCPTDAGKTLNETIASVINLLSAAVGVVAVFMIIFGGFRYITSAGNPESAKSARNTILYAVIGLFIVALAQIIVHFVLNESTKTSGTSSNNSGSSECPPSRPVC
jgi:cytochrome bd-type quinol oxidase subunit 2